MAHLYFHYFCNFHCCFSGRKRTTVTPIRREAKIELEENFLIKEKLRSFFLPTDQKVKAFLSFPSPKKVSKEKGVGGKRRRWEGVKFSDRASKREEEGGEKRWDFFLPSSAYSRWLDFLKAFSPKHTLSFLHLC